MFYRDNKIMRFINKNRTSITVIIGIIVFILLLMYTFSYYVSTRSKDSANINNKSSNIINSTTVIKNKQTVINQDNISEKVSEENSELINQFIKYCNEKNIEEAYNLLSDECKQNLYQTIDMFNKNYIQTIFKEKMKVELISWTKDKNSYTYIVNFIGDILSTGNYKKDPEFQDYITVDSKNKKININRYIGRKNIDEAKEEQNIIFKINYIDIYKDYEIYNITVSNKNDNQVILDNLNSTSSTYILTNENTKINCLNYEAGIDSFKYDRGVSKNIKLKFMKQYNIDIEDEQLVFSSVILNPNEIENTQKITIDI